MKSETATGISSNCKGGVSANPLVSQDRLTCTSNDFENSVCQLSYKICLCEIRGDITGHTVEYEIFHGLADELLLWVCRWCLHVLVWLGFKHNQVLNSVSMLCKKARAPDFDQAIEEQKIKVSL